MLGEIADDLADLFGDASDFLELVEDLADEINDRLEEAIDNLADLDLPDELSVDDILRVAADVVTGLPVIRDGLQAAFVARSEAELAEARKADAAARHADVTQAKQQAERDRQRAIAGRPPRSPSAARSRSPTRLTRRGRMATVSRFRSRSATCPRPHARRSARRRAQCCWRSTELD